MLLYYGMFAPGRQRASHLRFADYPGFTAGKLQRYTEWYLPDPARRSDPLAAPLLAEDAALAALPPVHILALKRTRCCRTAWPCGAGFAAGAFRAAGRGTGDAPRVLQMSQHLQDARQALTLCGRVARDFASGL